MFRLVFSKKFGFPHDYHVEMCHRYSICYNYYNGECDGECYRKPQIAVLIYSPYGRRKIYLRQTDSECFTELHIYEDTYNEIDYLSAPIKDLKYVEGAVLIEMPDK